MAKKENAALSALIQKAPLYSIDKPEEVIKFVDDEKTVKHFAERASLASIVGIDTNVVKLGQSLMGDLKVRFMIFLQKLVFLYLGKRLTKTQQMSNWNRRPLTSSQLHYAACDALVLIHLYDVLLERLLKSTKPDFSIDSISNVLDVHVEIPPKCTFCFEYFDNKKRLKAHRQECSKGVRTPFVCGCCGDLLFVEKATMEEHKKHCGNGIETPAEHAPIDSRKRSSSVSIKDTSTCTKQENATIVSNKAKARKRARVAKKEEATVLAVRTRKMSEGTLFAADDIWKEISVEQEDNLSS
ncbi:hypothetical protein P43SY_002797 [Pythium insidiosum]|uniref:3'-5' exonuclease domain-containing protein n=1 Tax=Pythium insidiosum TaxID=114742 RepID=A0AAD5MAK2_PYTIN|nr:hypothetical protein P43SY_002797 [Pythium insidiosum]